VPQDRLQGSRFEQKYIITEEVALQIRDYVRSFLEVDENCVGKPNHSYPVHSLYLDSDDLKLYWGTINGDKNRFKLRLRFYDDNPVRPVFLELKQRIDKRHVKRRAPVRREAVDWLLAGDTPQSSHLVSDNPEDFAALQKCCEGMYEIDARPTLHVAYFREAWMSRGDNSARLTMDPEVRAQPEPTARLLTTMVNSVLLWGRDIVVELKFTGRFPDFFRDLVRTFGLRQCGAAKYVDSVATLGEYKLRPSSR
jgi:SPX domain protein involved in polyphosphate accumulation